MNALLFELRSALASIRRRPGFNLLAVLVLSAGGDPSEAAEITRAFSFLGIKRLLASRLDTARHYGALLAAADANDLALCQMTDSPQVAGGLRSLHAATLADLLMEYKYDH